MARAKRTYSQRIADLQVIGDLYCKGKSQHDIATEMNLSQQQISYDLKEVHARWLKTAVKQFDVWVADELAKVDHLEREAWAAWERSRGERREITVEGAPAEGGGITPRKAKRMTYERDGDPRFLEKVQWCIERRAKLLGLDKPEKHAFTDPTGQHAAPANVTLMQVLDVQNMSLDELDIVGGVLRRQLQAASPTSESNGDVAKG